MKKTRFCAYICKNWIDLHQTKQKIINPFYTNMIQIRPQLFVVSCEPKLKLKKIKMSVGNIIYTVSTKKTITLYTLP